MQRSLTSNTGSSAMQSHEESPDALAFLAAGGMSASGLGDAFNVIFRMPAVGLVQASPKCDSSTSPDFFARALSTSSCSTLMLMTISQSVSWKPYSTSLCPRNCVTISVTCQMLDNAAVSWTLRSAGLLPFRHTLTHITIFLRSMLRLRLWSACSSSQASEDLRS